MKQKPKHHRASALLLATILLFAILTIIISLSSVTVMEMKMSQKGKSSVASFYDAESGVEWALNKIANTNGDIKNSLSPNADGSINCPSGIGVSCKVYFLKEDGTVMTQAEINATTDAPTFADIQAVRSVGREGNETQRAIEAAVAAGSCPGGFTSVEKGGNQLGCIQTSEEGEDPFFSAAKKCFDKYGGRLPSHTEWYISMVSYSLSGGSGRNWIDGDLNWWQADEIYGGQVIATSEAPYQGWSIGRNGNAYGYRCWIPK
ncbi:MAG: pilus assembly PilX N-terminal domain-containing protein [Parcubacteria group bacterium]|jgi:hypothetical protein